MIRNMAIAALILASASITGAQSKGETALGTWKGTSLCTVRPSPCHDETVVYTISRSPGKRDLIVWKADKIVNGVQENMGTLECSYSSSARTLTCDMPNKGVWQLIVDGDSMTGTLKLPDGTIFRKVSVKRRQ